MPRRETIHARCGRPWTEHASTGEPFHFPRCADEDGFIADPPDEPPPEER